MSEDPRILAIADQLAAIIRDRLPQEQAEIDDWLSQLLSDSDGAWSAIDAGERQLLVLLAKSGLSHICEVLAMRREANGR